MNIKEEIDLGKRFSSYLLIAIGAIFFIGPGLAWAFPSEEQTGTFPISEAESLPFEQSGTFPIDSSVVPFEQVGTFPIEENIVPFEQVGTFPISEDVVPFEQVPIQEFPIQQIPNQQIPIQQIPIQVPAFSQTINPITQQPISIVMQQQPVSPIIIQQPAPDIINDISNEMTVEQSQNQDQFSISNSNATTGPISINVGGTVPIQTIPVQNVVVQQREIIPQVVTQPVMAVGGGAVETLQTKQLPKTGLPLAAFPFAGLIPLGARLRRFGKDDPKKNATYLWQRREFLKE